ncbi:MAG: flagellar biosynthetic protein FliR [Treponema sp.]|jgi:flagellar biosynthetic protein FliR|nr:flagellar biosynthetic protein FliR [Treponema sp.]
MEEMLNETLRAWPTFLLVAARALAMIETAPLMSSDSIPQAAKLALAGFAAYSAFPTALASGWNVSAYNLNFVYLIIGEGLIGVIIGFYLTLIFSAFSTAGQFFSLQMGFGASEAFDPLTQTENPLLGQYLNIVAMLVFVSASGFQELFLGGFWRSIQTINIVDLAAGREYVISMLLTGLSGLFLDAMIISMPILGTLFLTSLTTGLISKAAPQVNILSEGFPISITVAFVLIYTSMPFMVEAFSRIIDAGFKNIESLYAYLGGAL